MRRTLTLAVVLSLSALDVRAEHFDITLVAMGPGGAMQQSFADQYPPEGGLNPRPVLKARVGDRLTVQFILTNIYPHGMPVGAGVRYFVVREREIGQKAVPPLSAGVVIEGSFALDLKPHARVGTRQQIVIRQPGNYLLRVESQRTQRDHEHFAAIDLQIS